MKANVVVSLGAVIGLVVLSAAAFIGGEYLFIPLVAWTEYKLINVFLKVLEDEMYAETGREKAGGRGTAGLRNNR